MPTTCSVSSKDDCGGSGQLPSLPLDERGFPSVIANSKESILAQFVTFGGLFDIFGQATLNLSVD